MWFLKGLGYDDSQTLGMRLLGYESGNLGSDAAPVRVPLLSQTWALQAGLVPGGLGVALLSVENDQQEPRTLAGG